MEGITVDGVFLLTFLNAGRRLRLHLDIDNTAEYEHGTWYDIEVCNKIISSIDRYLYRDIMLNRIGEEMIRIWYGYNNDEGIKSGVDFIRLQTSSDGYRKLVNGPEDLIGKFELLDLNERTGIARIHSTTPFPVSLEKGILYGGMGLFEDMLYFDVNFDEERYFDIKFVTGENMSSISWNVEGIPADRLEWRRKHITNKFYRKANYVARINESLSIRNEDLKADFRKCAEF